MTKEQLIALLNDMSLEEKVESDEPGDRWFFDDDTVITGPMAEMGFTEENIELSCSVIGSMGAETVKNPEIPHGKTSASYPTVIHAGHHQWLQTVFPIPLGQEQPLSRSFSEKCVMVGSKKRHPSVVCM